MKNLRSIRVYTDKNGINYPTLCATEEIIKAYRIDSYPIFFILDENRTIRKVLRGYSEESSGKEILEMIEELL
ncbi:MAG: hypothetical protein LUD15_14045 [Bacteroides sp.]|nr:hypothetical protein [Bacteroides sp.]